MALGEGMAQAPVVRGHGNRAAKHSQIHAQEKRCMRLIASLLRLRLSEAMATHRPRFGANARRTNSRLSGLAFGKADR